MIRIHDGKPGRTVFRFVYGKLLIINVSVSSSVTYAGRASTPALPHYVTVTPQIPVKIPIPESEVLIMNFFLPMKPPTVTHQMQKVRVVKSKPVFYDPPEVREARQMFTAALAPHAPSDRLTGPVSLTVIWLFSKGSSHENGEWRITRPDTDNLQKLLKDCMTAAGFWIDDAQVCREVTEKRWADEPTGIYIEIEALTGKEASHV